MKIVIFGANGNLGKPLVERLLADGHEVRAAIYPVKPTNFSDQVEVVEGNILDEGSVERAIAGCEAVISVVGGPPETLVRSRGMANIVHVMQKLGLRRVVTMGGAGALPIAGRLLYEFPFFPNSLNEVTKEHVRVHQILVASGLDWTQVCPTYMREGEFSGQYKLRADRPFLLAKLKVRFTDVADFIAHELRTNKFVGHQVAIASK